MFKHTLNTHEIAAVGFTSVCIPFDATYCVFVLLSAVDVPVGIQQVSGSTPTAFTMPLNCLCLSLSFERSTQVLRLYQLLRMIVSALFRCTLERQMIDIQPRLSLRPRCVRCCHRRGSAMTYGTDLHTCIVYQCRCRAHVLQNWVVPVSSLECSGWH